MRDHPAFGAGLDAWQRWIDEVAPLGGQADPGLPAPLQGLTRNPLRELAAVAAENWFRTLERDRQRRGQVAPVQVELRLGHHDKD
jgi:hypothetical protein